MPRRVPLTGVSDVSTHSVKTFYPPVHAPLRSLTVLRGQSRDVSGATYTDDVTVTRYFQPLTGLRIRFRLRFSIELARKVDRDAAAYERFLPYYPLSLAILPAFTLFVSVTAKVFSYM